MNVTTTSRAEHIITSSSLAHFQPADAVNGSPACIRPPTWLGRVNVGWRLSFRCFLLDQPFVIDSQHEWIARSTSATYFDQRQRDVESAVKEIYIFEIAKRVRSGGCSGRQTERSGSMRSLLLRGCVSKCECY